MFLKLKRLPLYSMVAEMAVEITRKKDVIEGAVNYLNKPPHKSSLLSSRAEKCGIVASGAAVVVAAALKGFQVAGNNLPLAINNYASLVNHLSLLNLANISAQYANTSLIFAASIAGITAIEKGQQFSRKKIRQNRFEQLQTIKDKLEDSGHKVDFGYDSNKPDRQVVFRVFDRNGVHIPNDKIASRLNPEHNDVNDKNKKIASRNPQRIEPKLILEPRIRAVQEVGAQEADNRDLNALIHRDFAEEAIINQIPNNNSELPEPQTAHKSTEGCNIKHAAIRADSPDEFQPF